MFHAKKESCAFHSNHLSEETFWEEKAVAAEGVMKVEEAPYCAICYKLPAKSPYKKIFLQEVQQDPICVLISSLT